VRRIQDAAVSRSQLPSRPAQKRQRRLVFKTFPSLSWQIFSCCVHRIRKWASRRRRSFSHDVPQLSTSAPMCAAPMIASDVPAPARIATRGAWTTRYRFMLAGVSIRPLLPPRIGPEEEAAAAEEVEPAAGSFGGRSWKRPSSPRCTRQSHLLFFSCSRRSNGPRPTSRPSSIIQAPVRGFVPDGQKGLVSFTQLPSWPHDCEKTVSLFLSFPEPILINCRHLSVQK
jgi:hypothetical protein